MTTQPVYDSLHFFRKFSAIPEERWIIGFFGDEDNGPHCAYGHCGERTKYVGAPESLALSKVFQLSTELVINVNDGTSTRYQQSTPKQRILAALADIIKLENKELPNLEEPAYRFEKPERIRYVTVTVDASVRELQGSLTEN